MFQMVTAFLGVCTVCLIALTAKRVWGNAAAVRAAWVAALFPAFIVYSVVELREVWVTVFLSLAVLFIVRWIQEKRIVLFMLSLMSFVASSSFHGGVIFAAVALSVMSVGLFFRSLFEATRTKRLPAATALAPIVVLVAGLAVFASGRRVHLSGIGDISTLDDQLQSLDESTEKANEGDAQYPGFLRIEGAGIARILAVSPLRQAYLLFSPFPWDIRAPQHLIGLMDGSFYLVCMLLLWKERKWLRRQDEILVLLGIVVMLSLAYGWGTSNFGTAMRHRAKFGGIIIIMSSGLLGRRRWRRTQLEGLFARKRQTVPVETQLTPYV